MSKIDSHNSNKLKDKKKEFMTLVIINGNLMNNYQMNIFESYD